MGPAGRMMAASRGWCSRRRGRRSLGVLDVLQGALPRATALPERPRAPGELEVPLAPAKGSGQGGRPPRASPSGRRCSPDLQAASSLPPGETSSSSKEKGGVPSRGRRSCSSALRRPISARCPSSAARATRPGASRPGEEILPVPREWPARGLPPGSAPPLRSRWMDRLRTEIDRGGAVHQAPVRPGGGRALRSGHRDVPGDEELRSWRTASRNLDPPRSRRGFRIPAGLPPPVVAE